MGISARRMTSRVGVLTASAGLVILAAAPALAAPSSPGPPNQLDAVNDVMTVTSAAGASVDLLTNDIAGDGGPATPQTVGVDPHPNPGPTKGTAVISPDGTATYVPGSCSAGDNNTPGLDSFGYTINDSQQSEFKDTATVTVTIMPAASAPHANTDTFRTDADGVAQGSLLANDCGPGPQATAGSVLLSGTPVRRPAKGTVSIFPSTGTFRYTASAGATGTDSFSYRISNQQDTSLSSTATVTITLTGGPPPHAGPVIPPAQNPPAQNPPQGQPQNPPAHVQAPASNPHQQQQLPATGAAGTISIAVIGAALVLLGALLAAVGQWWPAPAGRPSRSG